MPTFHLHQTQRNPADPHWAVNCTAYCGAMLANDATVGGLLGITGRYIRAKSSEPNPDPGSPGLNILQVRSVLTGLRITTQDMTGNPRGDVVDALEQKRRVLIQVDYKTMGTWRDNNAGDFGHALVLYKHANDGDLWASDPLRSRGIKYPADVIFEAARVFARETGVGDGLRWMMTRGIPLVA